MENQNWGNPQFNPWNIPQGGNQAIGMQGTKPSQQPISIPRPILHTERLAVRQKELSAFLSQNGWSGFQVVRREFVSHSYDPAMTVRSNSITFNNACISRLEKAKYIQFLINPELKALAIRPCSENARNAVRWCTVKADKRKSRQITCRELTERLYELMGWEKVYRYKLQGFGHEMSGAEVYVFDLTCDESFAPLFKDPETGKTIRPKAEWPEEWKNSFGMSVEEHDKYDQIDFASGFLGVDEVRNGIGRKAEEVSVDE